MPSWKFKFSIKFQHKFTISNFIGSTVQVRFIEFQRCVGRSVGWLAGSVGLVETFNLDAIYENVEYSGEAKKAISCFLQGLINIEWLTVRIVECLRLVWQSQSQNQTVHPDKAARNTHKMSTNSRTNEPTNERAKNSFVVSLFFLWFFNGRNIGSRDLELP